MRWTDEVHVSRTLAARREARKVYRGNVPETKGHSKTLPLLVAVGTLRSETLYLFNFGICPVAEKIRKGCFAGALAALATCEKSGKLRVSRLPVVGSWLNSKLKVLRRHLFWKGRLPDLAGGGSSRPPARTAAGAAAIKRQVSQPCQRESGGFSMLGSPTACV